MKERGRGRKKRDREWILIKEERKEGVEMGRKRRKGINEMERGEGCRIKILTDMFNG